jgi:Metallo-beta-lactamase superfamily
MTATEVITMTQLASSESALEGLYPSTPESLPFAPELHVRAFVLKREEGNVLVYSVKGLEADAGTIEGLGGISRHYLNHRHEAIFASDWVDAPLFVHERERKSVERAYQVRATFSRRHMLDGDVEVIPTPGHTPGATAYLWDSGEHRFLFTGDTIYLRDGEWVAAVLDSSDRAAYLDSLDLIRELDYDVLVPWAATAGDPPYAVTSNRAARRRIDAILDRVRRGDDH